MIFITKKERRDFTTYRYYDVIWMISDGNETENTSNNNFNCTRYVKNVYEYNT